MDWFVGTSGYSYAAWKGTFYPEDLPAARMLEHYGQQLNAVEINNTFYRLPKPDVVRSWGEQVPDDFRFVIKASRRITHFTRLGPDSVEPTDFLFRSLAEMGPRLGAVLFQLPPNMKAGPERLEAFLGALPEGASAAFEFRHVSWEDAAVRDLLASHGAALVHADTDEGDEPDELASTAPWGYVRLRRSAYSDEDLDRWADRIAATGWSRTFVFFKHEDEGVGPRLARAFLERVRAR
jgi:uncharacterized protein YecE (DUF72 family)